MSNEVVVMRSSMVGPVALLLAASLCHLVRGTAHSGESMFPGGQTIDTTDGDEVDVTVTSFEDEDVVVADPGACKCETVKPRDADETIGHVKINMKDGVVCTNVEPVDVIEECRGYCHSKDKPGPFGKYGGGITQCHFCGRVQTFVDVMMKCKKKKYKQYGYQRKEYYETYRQLFKNVPLDTGCKCQDCQPEHGYSSIGSAAPVNYPSYNPGYKQQYQPEPEPVYETEYQPEYTPPYQPPAYQPMEYGGGDSYKKPAYQPPPPPYGGGDTYKKPAYPPPPPYGGGDTYKKPAYQPPPPPYGGGGGYKKPAYPPPPAYGEKEKCKKLVLESKLTYAQFTMGTCEDSYGKQQPCCYNADYISGLVKGCTGICQSRDDWSNTMYEGDKYYKQQVCKCCTPIKENIQVTLTCPYYYYKTIKRTFSVQTSCKCQPCPGINPYKPHTAEVHTGPPTPNCLAHGGMVFTIGTVVLRKVNYQYGQCFEDKCELDDKALGVIRRYSISCEVGDNCKPYHYNDPYKTIKKFVYKPNATMTCQNNQPVTQLICHCGGTCLSYTSTSYAADYKTDNMHHDSKISKNCKCCEAITGFIKVKLTCYTPDSQDTTETEMYYNVPLGCKCNRCNQTSMDYGSYGGYGSGGGYGGGGGGYGGGSYYPQTPAYPTPPPYNKPAYPQPKPAYQPPYNPPKPAYQPPYNPPKPAYEPYKPTYKPPYNPPTPAYQPPYNPPKPAYQPPYNPPKPAYQPPYTPPKSGSAYHLPHYNPPKPAPYNPMG